MKKPLLSDWNFQKELKVEVSQAICLCLKRNAPFKDDGLAFILSLYGVNFRFNHDRGGQDIQADRLNIRTDKFGNITDAYCG